MSTLEKVKAAKSPQHAMLAIAEALDRIEQRLTAAPQEVDPWGDWGQEADADVLDTSPVIHAEVVEDSPFDVVVQLPPCLPGSERYDQRLLFAKQSLQLDDYYASASGDTTTPEGYDSWNDVYARGGPMWLYNSDRDCVMSLPYETRRMLVADIERDHPQTAREVGRDILKYEAMTGPGHGVGPLPEGLSE